MNGIDILRWLAARLAACAAYLGHDPWLLPAKAVRPFVSGNKNDAHDARAIWTAAQMPGIKTVAVKSEEQQAILALHRIRQQLVKFRTAQINGLRGLLTEYGEVMPKGRAGMARAIAPALERVPPVDYRDKLPPKPWYTFTPPLTHVICRSPSLWRYLFSWEHISRLEKPLRLRPRAGGPSHVRRRGRR